MKPEVEKALEELATGLPDAGIESKEDPDGGAFVLVDGIDIGSSFEPTSSWIAFHITFGYPDADVYPHFIDPKVRYVGSGDAPNLHPEGDLPMSMTRGGTAPGFERPAIQVSRRSNRRNAETDSALQKLMRIIAFLRSR